jgi:hypothetical protein
MDAWLGPGFEPSAVERRSILSRLSNCSVISSSADGALRSRTALIEQVGQSGGSLTVRLLGSGVYDDIIPNPRIVLTARPALGPHDLVVVNGLARIQSRMATAGERELPLLDVAVQRMECWGSTATIAPRPATPLVEDRERLSERHETMALRQA